MIPNNPNNPNNIINPILYNNSGPRINSSNVLSNEEIDSLQQNGNINFSVSVPPEEHKAALCTHIDKNGLDVVQQIAGTNKVYCPICHQSWDTTPYTKQAVVELIEKLISILQNIKWLAGVRLPRAFQREFWVIIALLRKVPELYEYALNFINNLYNQQFYNGAMDANSNANYNLLYNGIAAYGMPQYYNGMPPQFAGQNVMGYGMPNPATNGAVPFNPNINAEAAAYFNNNMMNMNSMFGGYNTPNMPMQGQQIPQGQQNDWYFNPNNNNGYINTNPNMNPMEANNGYGYYNQQNAQPAYNMQNMQFQQNNAGLYVPQNQAQQHTFNTMPPQQPVSPVQQPPQAAPQAAPQAPQPVATETSEQAINV